MRIGHAGLSATEQNLDLQRDALKRTFYASVDHTDARKDAGHAHAEGGTEPRRH